MIILKSVSAKSRHPKKWSRMGRCPSCNVTTNCMHKSTCTVVYESPKIGITPVYPAYDLEDYYTPLNQRDRPDAPELARRISEKRVIYCKKCFSFSLGSYILIKQCNNCRRKLCK